MCSAVRHLRTDVVDAQSRSLTKYTFGLFTVGYDVVSSDDLTECGGVFLKHVAFGTLAS